MALPLIEPAAPPMASKGAFLAWRAWHREWGDTIRNRRRDDAATAALNSTTVQTQLRAATGRGDDVLVSATVYGSVKKVVGRRVADGTVFRALLTHP
jgi:hypothetical protein